MKGNDRIAQDSIFVRRQMIQHRRQSSNPWNLTKKSARTDPRLHIFGLRVIDDWNALSYDVKTLEKLNVFKSKLRS